MSCTQQNSYSISYLLDSRDCVQRQRVEPQYDLWSAGKGTPLLIINASSVVGAHSPKWLHSDWSVTALVTELSTVTYTTIGSSVTLLLAVAMVTTLSSQCLGGDWWNRSLLCIFYRLGHHATNKRAGGILHATNTICLHSTTLDNGQKNDWVLQTNKTAFKISFQRFGGEKLWTRSSNKQN